MDGKPRKDTLSFSMNLDVETWEECEPPDRPEATARLAAEFLKDLTEEMKSTFKAEYESTKNYKQYLKRMSEYRLPPKDVEEGLLISFGDIVAHGKEDTPSKGTVFSFSFTHEGKEYLVADLYCPKPKCKCNEVHLMIVEKGGTPEKPVVKDRAMVAISLKGKISVRDTFKGTRKEAEELAAKWQALNPEALKTLKWRYKEMKKIGKRSLAGGKAARGAESSSVEKEAQKGGGAAPAASTKKGGKPGRNAPCPCGSGKKYKKCCGL